MNKQNHQAGWRFGCIQGGEAKELHDNSGCSDSTDHSPLNLAYLNMLYQSSHNHIASEHPKNSEDSSEMVQKTGSFGDYSESWNSLASMNNRFSTSHVFNRKLFVCGLNKYATEDCVKRCFAKFGQVVEIELIRHHKDQRIKGICYVTFASAQSVANVLNSPSSHSIKGKRIQCLKYVPRLLELERDLHPDKALRKQKGSAQSRTAKPSRSAPRDITIGECRPILRVEHPAYRFNRESLVPSSKTASFGQTVFRKYQARVVARLSQTGPTQAQ